MTYLSTNDDSTDRRASVRETYASLASTGEGCCETDAPDDHSCSTASENETVGDESTNANPVADESRSLALGYDGDDLEEAPDGSNLGLGCGNPVAVAALEEGESVLDLGSGGGFDCFLAAQEVGPEGQIIGVDMTPEMIDRARENARESEFDHVEFRLGEIEHLPVADETIDVILSNCVVNLSSAKPQVFREAFRVLRPGGKLAISDLVATEPLPPAVRDDPEKIDACVGGAATIDELERWLAAAGFVDGSITVEGEWTEDLPIVSARIDAKKPA
ncbi:arsenite methyltransferase [Natronolimnobius sp. AArcel1]|uniref:arsenite methyltransferase n=1 Tax=Natronolimnobius sp. AArcel1 TaxID=1679093 RepID=UPI0013ECA227|nr:arsenite methyltransferase [Natronolimnobius sp. AArcel1]NGM68076.1 arsenite methyltransferase [Natronolimnobius sp. AArcel1]